MTRELDRGQKHQPAEAAATARQSPSHQSQADRTITMTALRTFNVEAGLPTLDEARRRVAEEIRRARREGVRVLKVIHGYGSSGKGGRLCVGLRKSFSMRKREGVIKDFIAGEDMSIFEEATLQLLEAVPELRRDPDVNAVNEGVTFLWLK
jgi:hypothetical protein